MARSRQSLGMPERATTNIVDPRTLSRRQPFGGKKAPESAFGMSKVRNETDVEMRDFLSGRVGQSARAGIKPLIISRADAPVLRRNLQALFFPRRERVPFSTGTIEALARDNGPGAKEKMDRGYMHFTPGSASIIYTIKRSRLRISVLSPLEMTGDVPSKRN